MGATRTCGGRNWEGRKPVWREKEEGGGSALDTPTQPATFARGRHSHPLFFTHAHRHGVPIDRRSTSLPLPPSARALSPLDRIHSLALPARRAAAPTSPTPAADPPPSTSIYVDFGGGARTVGGVAGGCAVAGGVPGAAWGHPARRTVLARWPRHSTARHLHSPATRTTLCGRLVGRQWRPRGRWRAPPHLGVVGPRLPPGPRRAHPAPDCVARWRRQQRPRRAGRGGCARLARCVASVAAKRRRCDAAARRRARAARACPVLLPPRPLGTSSHRVFVYTADGRRKAVGGRREEVAVGGVVREGRPRARAPPAASPSPSPDASSASYRAAFRGGLADAALPARASSPSSAWGAAFARRWARVRARAALQARGVVIASPPRPGGDAAKRAVDLLVDNPCPADWPAAAAAPAPGVGGLRHDPSLGRMLLDDGEVA